MTLRTCVVIPTYNEVGTICAAIRRTWVAVPGIEVLVVDDGSSDGTVEAVRSLAASGRGDVSMIERSVKAGLGSAYRAGFALALDGGFHVIVEMDGDLQHDPSMLPVMIDAIGDGADLVIGSRYVPGASISRWGLVRRLVSLIGNRVARLATGLPVRDSTSGFRAYRASILRLIDLRTVTSDGYAFQVEMVAKVDQADGTICEVPITFAERVSGQSKMNLGIAGEAIALTVRLLADRVRTRIDRA